MRFFIYFFFFFSSRRRHTRLTCDWSSDVCSSDLLVGVKSRQCFLRSTFASDRMKPVHQILDLWRESFLSAAIPAHALDKIKPEFRVRARSIGAAFVVAVGKNGAA